MVSDREVGADAGRRARWARCGRWAREPEVRAGSSSIAGDTLDDEDELRRREVAGAAVSGAAAGAGLRARSDPRGAPARRRASASVPNTAANRSTPPATAAAATSWIFDFIDE